MTSSPFPQPNSQEKLVIARAKQGDKEAFRTLVETYQDRVFGLVLSLVRHQQQAEDLTQEILVKTYFALPSFHDQSAFYTWLFRIASNHCLDALRKHRPQEVSLDQPMSDQKDQASMLQTFSAPIAEQPDTPIERQGALDDLFNELVPEHRLVLLLREVEGYSYEEMADLLNCAVNTVKSRLFRARDALKAAYLKRYGNIWGGQHVQESEGSTP